MAAIGAVAACLGALAPAAAAQTATGMPPRPQQLGSSGITYYWFVPESAFTGARIVPKGLTAPYREDFLYSARGIAMQGTGTADDGKMLHWRSGAGAWVNKEGLATRRWPSSPGSGSTSRTSPATRTSTRGSP